ncbi:MAG: hypothetical protein ACP5IT_06440 [Thermoproteota archaeon]
MSKRKIPNELSPISNDIETLIKELNNLLDKLTRGTKDVKSKLKASVYGKKSIRDFNKNDLKAILSFYEPLEEETKSFRNYIMRINEAIDKGFTVLYVSTVLRKLLPPENLIDFAKYAYGISITEPDKEVAEVAKVIVERNEIDKINERVREYLIHKGIIVDVINMTSEEIKREFENDQKYPDVESIKKKLPDELRSLVSTKCKKKQTAIKKIIEEVEKLRSIRRLGPS